MRRNLMTIGMLAIAASVAAPAALAQGAAGQPIITAAHVSVGGDMLTINGYDFGEHPPTVSLGMTPLTVLAGSSSNSVTALLPPMEGGTYLLVLERSDVRSAGVFYLTVGATSVAAPQSTEGSSRRASRASHSVSRVGDDDADAPASGDDQGVGEPDTLLGSYAVEGPSNTFYGLNAGDNITSGVRNTGFGLSALLSTLSGLGNTAVGFESLRNNRAGSNNTGTGSYALQRNESGQFNTAMGKGALQSNRWGNRNTAVGGDALLRNWGGGRNTAVGFNALKSNTGGSNNIAIGHEAGTNATGSNNIYLQHAGVGGESNKIRIGTDQTDTILVGTVTAPAFEGDGSGLTGIVAVYQ